MVFDLVGERLGGDGVAGRKCFILLFIKLGLLVDTMVDCVMRAYAFLVITG
jgi:hypothetical protein